MYRTKFFNQVHKKTSEFLKENSNISIENQNTDEADPSLIPIEEINNNLTKDQLDFMNQMCFPIELKMLYNIVGSTNEITINCENETGSGFTFLTLDRIMEHINDYVYIVDIGTKYHGMGHWYALTFDKKTKQFFFRIDGGGNGLEREVRYKFYKSLNPSINRKIRSTMFQFNINFMDYTDTTIDAFDFV